MTSIPRLESKVFIQGTITTETGLHIGGNSVGMAIGGADSVVVRNPRDNLPYIPGSSLRGKMRSLLERVRGDERVNSDGEGGFSMGEKNEALAGQDPNTLLGQLFGVAAEQEAKGPSRLIVRDAPLLEESRSELESAPNTDMPLSEVKTEVWIDRITSEANPRQIERVPAGAHFGFELILSVLEGDDQDRLLRLIWEGLQLVEADTLGGNGSRGYGQVKFVIKALKRRHAADYREGRLAHSLDIEAIPPGLQSLGDQR